MSDTPANQGRSGTRLQAITVPPVDETTASMIDLLQEHLRLARAGQLRSLAVVSVSADGAAIGTQWSCDPPIATETVRFGPAKGLSPPPCCPCPTLQQSGQCSVSNP